jgi:SAM-dependent methyltransferase
LIDERVAASSTHYRGLIADRGSFRDRANRVYDDGEKIVRGINAAALANWTGLSGTAFFKQLVEAGRVVGTRLLSAGESVDVADGAWAAYLVHDRVPFISYPYEWCFGMLKDAALLHLEILERAIPCGWTLKDATAYNVQFVGAMPVFIDIPSFVPYKRGEPWVGYRQFCMMFLYPLMLRAYRGIDYLPLLRGNLEGIDPETANRILSGRDRVRKGVFGHVYLHSKMQSRYRNRDLDQAKLLTEEGDRRPELQKVGRHTEAMVVGMIQGLRRTVERLKSPDDRTTWGDYETDHSYAEKSYSAKKAFVEQVVKARRRKLVWDVGCNTGTFSAIAASNSDYVVAIDGDTKAIERLYQRQKKAGATNILPIVMNLGSASPNQGWRGTERKALENRAKPELILCLALIHHIVISANIPLQEFVGWLRDFECEVVIEAVGLGDDMTRMLLRNRVNQYDELEDDTFERILGARFHIVRSEPLKGGMRKIYHLSPK